MIDGRTGNLDDGISPTRWMWVSAEGRQSNMENYICVCTTAEPIQALECWSSSVWLKEKETPTVLKLLLLNWIFGTAAKPVSWIIHNSSHMLAPPKTLLLTILHRLHMIVHQILSIPPEKNLSNSIPLLRCHRCCLSSRCQDLQLRIFRAS